MVAQAEIIEIAENIAERRDRKSGHTIQTPGTVSGSGSISLKAKNQSTDSSVRAVMFGSKHKTHGKRHKKPYHRPNDGSQ